MSLVDVCEVDHTQLMWELYDNTTGFRPPYCDTPCPVGKLRRAQMHSGDRTFDRSGGVTGEPEVLL